MKKNRNYLIYSLVLMASIYILGACGKSTTLDQATSGDTSNKSTITDNDTITEGNSNETTSNETTSNETTSNETTSNVTTSNETTSNETTSIPADKESSDEPAPTKVVYNTTSPLKDVFSDYFMMGAAINGNSVANAAINHKGMSEILKTHFNSTTLSNLMKPVYILDHEASKLSTDGMPVAQFSNVNSSLQFCMDNGIQMRGHTLVWHTQTPDWFFYEDYDITKQLVDAETMDRRLESYIKQVVEYCQTNYPGVIYCWDVVNEAINDNGTWRVSLWYQIMDETYIEKAFTYARKYCDEGVKLIYNDYNVYVPSKRLAIYTMAFNLKKLGIIDGLGLQPTVGLRSPELDSDSSASSFKKTLERFGELGLDIQITELSFEIPKDETITPELLQKQADRYYEMMYLLLKMDSENGGPCIITSVTVFGICDDYPLYQGHKQNLYLWDKTATPKQCYDSYLQAGLDFIAAQSLQ